MYILDFFGTNEVHHALNIPLSRVLTAFGSPWNTFLGFRRDAVSEAEAAAIVTKKRAQGVIWGKDPKHFKGREETLRHIAESVQLISTCQQRQTFSGANRITWRGHQTASSWQALLQESRFLLGLGDPLLGPSAIDAMAAGCMYINPIYEEPVRGIHQTQHDFAEREIGFPHVCSVKLSNITGLMKCIDYAMNNVIRSVVPTKMTKDAYMKRVKQIFEL
jgi:alpha-1,3(6)-mannosylglycoprotein beta-1,6-N-acetyl-glucosaminyltransferase